MREMKSVRLQGHHGKYLWAEDDYVTVLQDRDWSNEMAVWKIEQVESNSSNLVRLKSCYDCYLTASDIPFLPGMSGKKVLQTRPSKLDCTVEWELINVDDNTIKLRAAHSGKLLQANTSLPPWRSSVTHDTFSKEWCLWKMSVVESISDISSLMMSTKVEKGELPKMPPMYDERIIFYVVAECEAEVKNIKEWHYIFFRGRNPDMLTHRLRKEIDIDNDIIVCTRHPLSTKLFPLHLQLPPGTAPMYLVVLLNSFKNGTI